MSVTTKIPTDSPSRAASHCGGLELAFQTKLRLHYTSQTVQLIL